MYPGCLGQAVVASRLLCAIVESPRRHVYAPFVNITSLCSRSIKRRQWKHKLDYYGVVFAHLATGRGINAKDPSGLDWDRWIQHLRCCENPARAKALAGFSRHLSAGFTDLNPAPRGLSLYKNPSGHNFTCQCGIQKLTETGSRSHCRVCALDIGIQSQQWYRGVIVSCMVPARRTPRRSWLLAWSSSYLLIYLQIEMGWCMAWS